LLEKSVFQWYNSRKFPDLWENWNFARRKRRRVLMMGKLQMDREWTEQDLRTFAEGAQAAFETVLLDELPQDTGWQDEGLQVSYSLCNGRVSCVLHRTVRADGKLWRITMSAPLAGHRRAPPRRCVIAPTKIKEDLGWYPETPFEKGIVLTIDWYLAHPDWMAHVTSGDYQKYYEQMYKNK